MKKTLLALAAASATGSVCAQSSVTIYGNMDVGLVKKTGSTLLEQKRDTNKLGFKGVEDLGDGLKALFQLEMHFEPDTGTNEAVSRPLFQGESRVGLQGSFGTIRAGRGLSAYQESSTYFEPWGGLSVAAGFQTDLMVAGYVSTFGSGTDPLAPPNNSANRMANAVFYNSPVLDGFQLNLTVGSKENDGSTTALIGRGTATAPQYPIGAEGSVNPFSATATYNNGPYAAMLAFERNAVETKLWSVAGTLKPTKDLKLFASFQHQDESHTMLTNPDTRAWVLGANYFVGLSKILFGYGQKTPDGFVKTKQASIGCEYSLSKRTYLYVDVSNRKQPLSQTGPSVLTNTSVNFTDLGIHHYF